MDTNNIEAKLQLIEQLIILKNYSEALTLCSDVINVEPHNRDAVSYKAAMLIKLQKDSSLEPLLNTYRTANPAEAFQWFYAGMIYHRDKKTDAAERLYKEALKINPNYEPALAGLFEIYKQEENKEKSINDIEALLKSDRKSVV